MVKKTGPTWRTPMRKNVNGNDEDRKARRVDKLRGQAEALRMDDGRWYIAVMPDARTFAADAVVSAEDMRALAHAILDADRHPLDEVAPARQAEGGLR